MKIYLGSIAWRSYEAAFVKSLVQLIKAYPQVAFLPHVGDALVERARSVVATHFLEMTDADVLLTIDSDISFKPEDAIRICEQAMKADIVVGAYACRSSAIPKPSSHLWTEPVEFDSQAKLVPVKWGATGFMAAHRRVFERLASRPDMTICDVLHPWHFRPFYLPFIYDDPDGGHVLLSEDYAFCERARQEGFEVWLDPTVRLGHIGDYMYRLEDMVQKPLPAGPMRLTRTGLVYKAEYAEGVRPAVPVL